MASTQDRKVLLTPNNRSGGRPHSEDLANGSDILPGHLLEHDVNGDVITHLTADGAAQRMFAIEDPLSGATGANAIDTLYDDNETVRWIYAQPGDIVSAVLAANQTVTTLTPLSSAGDGALHLHAGAATLAAVDATDIMTSIVGMAVEAVTTGGAIGRVKVRIM